MIFDIVGNNIGAMVAAVELSKKGHKVRAINPLPFWGSHLAGKSVNGHDFDYGRIIFDFFSYNNDDSSVLSTYDAQSRNDVGRFYTHIRKYIESYLEVNELRSPEMYFKGKYLPDFLFADSLSVLDSLDEVTKKQIVTELENIGNKENPLHASNKKNPSNEFLNTDYAEVSKANHGETLHNLLIKPYLQKILSTDNPALNPLYHRIPWVPLYYPETLLSQFTDNPQNIPAPKFHYPTSGHFSTIIEKLKEQLLNDKNITVIHEKIKNIKKEISGDYTISLDTQELKSSKIIWASDQEQLIQALGLELLNEKTQKLPITFNLITVKTENIKKDFSVLVVVDKEELPFRITNQNICSGKQDAYTKLVVECNPKDIDRIAGTDEENQKAEVIKSLVSMGIVSDAGDIEDYTLRRFDQTIRIPNRENELIYDRYNEMINLHNNNIIKLGTSLNYVSVSINDHIVQGLQIAELYG